MVTWKTFAEEAPHIAGIFERRHRATGNLCMLGTIRSDGYPRISPVEPNIFEEHLVVVGMPGTTKFLDLGRNPRFTLHTATVDSHLGDGDAKLWADAVHFEDRDFQKRFVDDLFERTGFDLRDEVFDPFYVADIVGGSSVELIDNELVITIWKPGQGERKVKKT